MADPNRSGAPDPIEAQMITEGEVLHREKLVARRLAMICLVSGLAFSLIALAYLLGWGAGVSTLVKAMTFVLAPFMIFTGLTATVQRTVVTSQALHVSRGPSGREIPLGSITACEVVPFGRPYPKAEVFAPMAGAEGVLVSWVDGKGVSRQALIASEEPARLAEVVGLARQVAGGAGRRRLASGGSEVGRADDGSAEVESAEAERAEAERAEAERGTGRGAGRRAGGG